MIDFAEILDAPVYDRLGVAATITAETGKSAGFTVIDKAMEVDDEGLGGIAVPSVATAVRLRLSEMAEKAWTRADFDKAEIEMQGVLYLVRAARPAGNRRELELILTERT